MRSCSPRPRVGTDSPWRQVIDIIITISYLYYHYYLLIIMFISSSMLIIIISSSSSSSIFIVLDAADPRSPPEVRQRLAPRLWPPPGFGGMPGRTPRAGRRTRHDVAFVIVHLFNGLDTMLLLLLFLLLLVLLLLLLFICLTDSTRCLAPTRERRFASLRIWSAWTAPATPLLPETA